MNRAHDRRGDGRVGVEALEVGAVDVVKDWMEGVRDVKVRVADLRGVRGPALDVQIERKPRVRGANGVHLIAMRSHVGLDGPARVHEVLERVFVVAELLVVTQTTCSDVLGSEGRLPRQHDLVVLQNPRRGQVVVPVVDLVLGVGHAQQSKILLDGRGARGALAEDGDVDQVGKGGVEVAHVAAGFSGGSDCCAVADVVRSAVLISGPAGEGQVRALLGLERDGVARGPVGGRVGRGGICRVGDVFDVHGEDVLTREHPVDGRQAPVVGHRAVGRKHAGQDLIIKAGEGARLGQRNVHRFNVENHASQVVGGLDLVGSKPSGTLRGVVEDGLGLNHVDASREVMACNHGLGHVFSVDAGAGHGVLVVQREGKLEERDVVERDALEAVVDAVASIVVRTEHEVDLNRASGQGNALSLTEVGA